MDLDCRSPCGFHPFNAFYVSFWTRRLARIWHQLPELVFVGSSPIESAIFALKLNNYDNFIDKWSYFVYFYF